MASQDFSLRQLQPFLDSNPDRGTLRVQVSTAAGTFPIPQAMVEVAVIVGSGRVPLYRRRTDSSGIVDGFVLPAQPLYASQRPGTAGSSAVDYTVSVTHPAYEDVTDLPTEVFTGIKTILPVVLTPLTL